MNAKVLLHAEFNQQMQVFAWEQARKVREHALKQKNGAEARSSSLIYSLSKEFETDQTQAAMIIGQKGVRVQALEKRHGVSITVRDGEDGQKKVLILGNHEEDIAAVIDETQIVEETLEAS